MPNDRPTGWSFCLITDGRRVTLLLEALDSIRALGLPTYEIIVAGNVPEGLGPDVRVVPRPELAAAGRLGAMRNAACALARYDGLVVADDDMLFHADFADALQTDGDWDVLCVRLLNPDGTRYWDWATIGGPRGHVLLDYDETDSHVYVTGGLAVMRAAVHRAVPWHEALGFYKGEDVEWSARLRAAGMRIRFNSRGKVTHQDSRYTQDGRVMRFRQDLTVRERLAPAVDAIGVYRAGFEQYRWLSSEATLFLPPASSYATAIRFSLTSAAPGLTSAPFNVTVFLNGDEAGVVTFTRPETVTLTLPLQPTDDTVVRLVSDRSVSGFDVAIDDERPVSVLIHDAELVID